MRIRKPKTEINIKDLREEIIRIKDEGTKIISHYTKLEEYYADWEDRLYKIEKKIQLAEIELGLDKQEIEQYDALEDALS